MNNIYGQPGEPSATPRVGELHQDGITVKLLAGSTRGSAGQIVTLSRQAGLREIEQGHAVAV